MQFNFDRETKRQELERFFRLGVINETDASWNTQNYEFKRTTPIRGKVIDGHQVREMSINIMHHERNAEGVLVMDDYSIAYNPDRREFKYVDKFSGTSIPLELEKSLLNAERKGSVTVDNNSPAELQILQDVLLAAILFTETELSEELVKTMIAAIPESTLSRPVSIQYFM